MAASSRTVATALLRPSSTRPRIAALAVASRCSSCPSTSTAPRRHSHIGSAALYLPRDCSITEIDAPPHPRPNVDPPVPLPASLRSARTLRVSGPQGQLDLPLHDCLRLRWDEIVEEDSTFGAKSNASSETGASTAVRQRVLHLSVKDAMLKRQRALWGLSRALVQNALQGVSEGHSIILRMVGVGYRAALEQEPPSALHPKTISGEPAPPRLRLTLRLGYSHPIFMPIPAGITATVPQPTRIILRGADKAAIGQFAAQIRAWRKPEPYKGKGVFVGDETIRLKVAKKK